MDYTTSHSARTMICKDPSSYMTLDQSLPTLGASVYPCVMFASLTFLLVRSH